MIGRVLVTGAAGFIGWHCLGELRERGYQVFALGRKKYSHPDVVSWYDADIFDGEQVLHAMQEARPTHLLHLAWITQPGVYWTSRENLDWLCASIQLLQKFSEQGGRRAVLTGSCAEYDWTSSEYHETNTHCRPATLYGASKLALSLTAERYLAPMDISFAWPRLFSQFGPREKSERLVPQIIRGLLANQPVECRQADYVRDILPVQEVSRALATIVDSEIQGVINVGSGVALKLGELASAIASRMEKRQLLQLGQQVNPTEPLRMVADIGRLRDELCWRPRMDLDEGIEAAIQWWAQGRVG